MRAWSDDQAARRRVLASILDSLSIHVCVWIDLIIERERANVFKR